jgi:tetratricopeptide (TPR) repeat protein/KaiC/GvpD/RAD55 family RecA-like ATPase
LDSLERDRVPSPRPIAVSEIPLIDRIEEMRLLKEAVDRTILGEGGLVFLYGEAGIGKTRLARELRAYAHLRGMRVLYGRCPALFRMDGVPPYILWKEVIKDYLETCTLEQLDRVIGHYPAEVAKLVPELSEKLRTVPQSSPISPEQEQNRLFEAVSQFITNISQETPLLVVLDDLQWTDPSSLLLLHYLARGVQKTPLLLLGAYRSTDIDSKHPLTPVLAELKRERLPQSVSLKRMFLDDISEMIRQILEQDDVPSEFCRMVYEKTRGNPFFAEEVVESLKEEEAIYKEEDKWKFREISAIEFPESVKNVVKARFSRLDDECQSVLTLASFVGNDFTLEIMSTLTGIEENKLLETMDNLIKTGFIKHTVVRGEDICSFTDIIMRDVVHEEVGPFKRKKLHGDVGQALEKVYAEKVDEHLGELALHFLEGGDKEKARGYFLKAGEKAQKIYANAEAASYYQSALKLLEEKEGEFQEKERVLEQLGDIESLVGKYDACLKHWDEALLISTKLREKEKTATLHRKMANVLWDKIGDKEKAKEHHEEALKILEAMPESVELARVYKDEGHMLRRMGKFPEALRLEEKALGLAEKLNALEVVADSCSELSVETLVTGDFKKALEYADRALAISLENSYWKSALWAYLRVAAALPSEEYEKRTECVEKGLALAKKIGDVYFQSTFLDDQASICMDQGELGRAIALDEEALSMAKRAGDSFSISVILWDLGYAYLVLGEWEKSERYFNEASDVARNLSEYSAPILHDLFFGFLYASEGEYAKAKESFEKAVNNRKKAGNTVGEMWGSLDVAWASIELGEVEKAQNIIEVLQKFALEKASRGWKANEMALRATLLRAQKKYEESIELFEKTLVEWESMKANIWNAYWFARRILFEYARAYLERDKPGDKEKALNLLNRALEMFQKMGAKKDIEKVEAKIAFIETGKEVTKPRALEFVSMGYADLDKLLCGGIASRCSIVLTSPSCSERDQLIRSFLETGATNGEVTFYVTINPGPMKTLADEYLSNFHLFVCNPQADAIIKDSPNVVKPKGVENLTDISIALTSAIHKLDPSLKGPRRICLDLVSDVLLQHHAVQTRRWLAGLIPELQSEGFTTLAVMDSRIHQPEELYAIVGLFDGEFSIFEKETDKGPRKYLKIKRMSNQKYMEDEIILKRTA